MWRWDEVSAAHHVFGGGRRDSPEHPTAVEQGVIAAEPGVDHPIGAQAIGASYGSTVTVDLQTKFSDFRTGRTATA